MAWDSVASGETTRTTNSLDPPTIRVRLKTEQTQPKERVSRARRNSLSTTTPITALSMASDTQVAQPGPTAAWRVVRRAMQELEGLTRILGLTTRTQAAAVVQTAAAAASAATRGIRT